MALTLAKSDAITAYSSILANDGGTFNVSFGAQDGAVRFFPVDIADGYYVGGYLMADEHRIPLSEFSADSITAYVRQYSGLGFFGIGFLGAWIDNGDAVLDVSIWCASLDDATEKGRFARQDAVWDIANSREIVL